MRLPVILLSLLQILVGAPAMAREGGPPNIVILLADDAGYADFSFQGSRQFSTPNIDRIAKEGVRCTAGYVSGMVCSPTRAGLLTGRYQQRFGHEFNVPPEFSEENGLPTSETTFADRLKQAGYKTVAVGKWHLGYADHFHPLARGFSDYYGFLQGSRSYWPMQGTRLNRMLRDREPIKESFDYMTDELGRETARYIEKYRDEPFFLYVCYNAVHTPMHALDKDLAKFSHIPDEKRRILAAMTHALDCSVGVVLDALDAHGLTENTLVVFLSDNGGPISVNASNNSPLRGAKGQPFEGGIRVPFALRWPARLPKGVEYDKPVIALDLLPTALAAAGVQSQSKQRLDGVNLLPYLTGQKSERPHETLYWRSGARKAIRHHDLKLVIDGNAPSPMLFDLSQDIGEQHDLSSQRPRDTERLLEQLSAWEAELVPARWQSPAGRRNPAAKRRARAKSSN